ncbi:DUF4157 domain-containing protein [bacterium SCSIO 12741]|nr:DUF4157 domain-containing protein [bacterium SCSIO 12741]
MKQEVTGNKDLNSTGPNATNLTHSGKDGSSEITQLKDNRPIAQRQEHMKHLAENPPVQRQANNTGLPDNLKSGIENLSGYSMNDVQVHYNSSKPAQLNAHAYAQGSQIHLGPGQEKHLPHEAWHVVQQKQGRVQATTQLKAGTPINDDEGLEREADIMGSHAAQLGSQQSASQLKKKSQPKE